MAVPAKRATEPQVTNHAGTIYSLGGDTRVFTCVSSNDCTCPVVRSDRTGHAYT